MPRPHEHDDPSCDLCRSIWRGGRIRIDETSARLLRNLLLEERLRVLQMRADHVDDGTTNFNQRTRSLLRVADEVSRLMDEQGWLP